MSQSKFLTCNRCHAARALVVIGGFPVCQPCAHQVITEAAASELEYQAVEAEAARSVELNPPRVLSIVDWMNRQRDKQQLTASVG